MRFPPVFLGLITANLMEAIAQETIWGQSQVGIVSDSFLSPLAPHLNFSPGLVNLSS